MPRIFDNIDQQLLPALRDTMQVAFRSDFCVGYFNLRGWKQIDDCVDQWAGGDGKCCRLLVGMQRLPWQEMGNVRSLLENPDMDNRAMMKEKKMIAEEFRKQLTFGLPTDSDEKGLQNLAKQLREKKVIVKTFLRYQLHAKLYLLYRQDKNVPIVGYLGSSNLTYSGLSKQGELNVDVLDNDACVKLENWFKERWADEGGAVDISQELAEIIENGWPGQQPPPYHIYLKIAHHLSQDAIAGLTEFQIPAVFGNKLLPFQSAAVKIAAKYLNKRDGVIIGDVVGLGKTLTATALAKVFEDDYGFETLIICPKNLVPMWQKYRLTYGLRGDVLSFSQCIDGLEKMPRHRIVIIDESHNLRNREGKKYKAIQEYIARNDSKVILLSATPYNKTYLDLSSQLGLFMPHDVDIGMRPERLLKELGEVEFARRHQCPDSSLAAFEMSEHADDWRDLMRLFLVRRTRSFIEKHYAETDTENGRKYLTFDDGNRNYFPKRIPKTIKFMIDEKDATDQYALLFSPDVIDAINALALPRYGLGNYIVPSPSAPPTSQEQKMISDLSRGGRRLMGFCRTNLYKRLESSGFAFVQSIRRHILRNEVFLYALEKGKALPIGTQDVELLDTRIGDRDLEENQISFETEDDVDSEVTDNGGELNPLAEAKSIYELYETRQKKRFKWIRADLFSPDLEKHLRQDIERLASIQELVQEWDASGDRKLQELRTLLCEKHPNEKVLIFSQFADTVGYLRDQLEAEGIDKIAAVTGDMDNPAKIVERFSPKSNDRSSQISTAEELRVLIATDVLSEGQNLQDCAIVVNYDLPWAIIRLIQRVGRVDRIGQQSQQILCYSFLPADGVEKVLRLRERQRTRLQENADVVGTDEVFYEDEISEKMATDLYNEKAGVLDDKEDDEVDLSSYAFQIWEDAIREDPKLKEVVMSIEPVTYSTKSHVPTHNAPEGVLLYMQTVNGNDALAWVDAQGKSISESPLTILKAAACPKNTPAQPRREDHHILVKKGVQSIVAEKSGIGGQLGRPSGARHRVYERLKSFLKQMDGTLFQSTELPKALEEIYRYPLREHAKDILNRQLKSGISNDDLATLILNLRNDDRLCHVQEEQSDEPHIICSLGLSSSH